MQAASSKAAADAVEMMRHAAQRSAAAERTNVGFNLGSHPTPTSADAALGSHAPLRAPLPCTRLHSILASGTRPTAAQS